AGFRQQLVEHCRARARTAVGPRLVGREQEHATEVHAEPRAGFVQQPHAQRANFVLKDDSLLLRDLTEPWHADLLRRQQLMGALYGMMDVSAPESFIMKNRLSFRLAFAGGLLMTAIARQRCAAAEQREEWAL